MAKKAGKRAKKAGKRATKVMIHLPERPLSYADAVFRIRVRGEKLGQVHISQGGLDWYSRHAKRPKRFRWAQLAKLLDDA